MFVSVLIVRVSLIILIDIAGFGLGYFIDWCFLLLFVFYDWFPIFYGRFILGNILLWLGLLNCFLLGLLWLRRFVVWLFLGDVVLVVLFVIVEYCCPLRCLVVSFVSLA